MLNTLVVLEGAYHTCDDNNAMAIWAAAFLPFTSQHAAKHCWQHWQ